jgi:hypothetical protein
MAVEKVNKYARIAGQAQVARLTPTTSESEMQAPEVIEPRAVKEPKRAMGRPPGKRSNPEWEQLTAYIRKDTKRAALQRLMNENGQGARDLSEVIEQLVSSWAKQ